MICGLLTREAGEKEEDVFSIALLLNNFGFPEMGLQLASLQADEAVSRALQMNILLLQASPTENEIVTKEISHPHSQQEFYKFLLEPVGRRFVHALIKRFEELQQELEEEEDDEDDEDLEDQTLEEKMLEEMQDAHVIIQALSFLRLLTHGCFTATQDLMRSSKVRFILDIA